MTHINELLHAIESGDKQAAADLLPIVYDELRKLAKYRLSSERPDQTLQATELVHEAYRKLVDAKDGDQEKWNSEGHFFGAAATAMRRILIDRARQKSALKRGGNLRRVEFEEIQHPAAERPEELLSLDAALKKLEQIDPQKAELVQLRFFAGLNNKQVAKALGISNSTANRHWMYARAWLKTEMKRNGNDA